MDNRTEADKENDRIVESLRDFARAHYVLGQEPGSLMNRAANVIETLKREHAEYVESDDRDSLDSICRLGKGDAADLTWRQVLEQRDQFFSYAEALTATFQIKLTYSGIPKLIVTAPNGDCCEFKPNGERAERVLREASAALAAPSVAQGTTRAAWSLPFRVGDACLAKTTAQEPCDPMTGSTNRLLVQTEGWTREQYCARIAALERERGALVPPGYTHAMDCAYKASPRYHCTCGYVDHSNDQRQGADSPIGPRGSNADAEATGLPSKGLNAPGEQTPSAERLSDVQSAPATRESHAIDKNHRTTVREALKKIEHIATENFKSFGSESHRRILNLAADALTAMPARCLVAESGQDLPCGGDTTCPTPDECAALKGHATGGDR